MDDTIILYSVNTMLAYNINQRFYKQKHYVWCCPFFNSKSKGYYDANVPRSSLPAEIYMELLKDIRSNDGHSTKIKENRIGLLKGAVTKFKQGVISSDTKDIILSMIKKASVIDFTPLIYVIPFSKTKKLIEEVPIEDKASVLSPELRIKELPRNLFDIMDFDLF